jgi:putative PIN family toxin of toxin-antitoxin system
MKVVLDTNILGSALIKAGKPRNLFNKLVKDKQLVLSREILKEFLEVIENPKIAKYTSEKDLAIFLKTLKSAARIVQVKSKFKAVKEDPDDDTIIRAAYDSKSNYIVSGDKHLLSLGEYREIRIVNVDEMLRLLKDESTAN